MIKENPQKIEWIWAVGAYERSELDRARSMVLWTYFIAVVVASSMRYPMDPI